MGAVTTISRRREHKLRQLVAGQVRAELAYQGITGRELARRLGVNPMWVSSRTSGAIPIDIDDLEAIAEQLGVKPASLLLPRPDSNWEPADYQPRTELALAA